MATRSNAATDYRSLSDFRYEIRRFLNFSEREARLSGLEPQQHQALLAIVGLPPHRVATIGVLSERLQIQHHSAVELADRLEAKRLIRRGRTESDRRAVVLRLTTRGQKLLGDVTLPHLTELQTAGRKLLQTLRSVITQQNLGRSRSEFQARFEPMMHAVKSEKRVLPKRKSKRVKQQKEQHS